MISQRTGDFQCFITPTSNFNAALALFGILVSFTLTYIQFLCSKYATTKQRLDESHFTTRDVVAQICKINWKRRRKSSYQENLWIKNFCRTAWRIHSTLVMEVFNRTCFCVHLKPTQRVATEMFYSNSIIDNWVDYKPKYYFLRLHNHSVANKRFCLMWHVITIKHLISKARCLQQLHKNSRSSSMFSFWNSRNNLFTRMCSDDFSLIISDSECNSRPIWFS